MSTRDDATLSAQEREAFARIKAQVLRDDPTLGASGGMRLWLRLRRSVPALGRLLDAAWVGPVAVAIGAALIVGGLATTTALAVVGVAVVVAGGVGLARLTGRRWEARASDRGAQ